jgi:hypothetical protein
MKKILALVCTACASPAWAADMGVGVSTESNDSTIYVPIDFGDAWRIEPFVAYSKTKFGASARNEELSIGAGLFALQPLGESLQVYFGARLAYLDFEQAIYSTPFGTISSDGDGYRIAPTLGFEYSFNDHVSLGAEAAWFYEDIEGNFNGNQERTGTDTKLILRFSF